LLLVSSVHQLAKSSFTLTSSTRTEPKPSLRSLLLVIFLPIVWGTTFPIVKFTLNETTPLLFNVIRFGLTVVGFLAFSKSARQGLRLILMPSTKLERLIMLDALVLGFAIAAGYVLQVYGLMTTSASKCAFLTSTTIIWTPIFSYMTGRERHGKLMIAAIITTILGVLLLTHPYRGGLGFVIGDLLTLGCAFCFSIYILWVDRAYPRIMSITGSATKAAVMVTSNQLVVASILMALMLPFGPLTFHVSAVTVSSVLYLAIFATAMTAYIQARYQEVVSPSAAAVIYMLEPVVAAMIGYLFLMERLGTEESLGALLIVLGVIIAQFPTLRASKSRS
jgi:drug/metabolite transporter (DMT)-like permease